MFCFILTERVCISNEQKDNIILLSASRYVCGTVINAENGTIDAPGEAAEESLECVVVKEADRTLLPLLLSSLPARAPGVRGL